jgi:hypothetical protein
MREIGRRADHRHDVVEGRAAAEERIKGAVEPAAGAAEADVAGVLGGGFGGHPVERRARRVEEGVAVLAGPEGVGGHHGPGALVRRRHLLEAPGGRGGRSHEQRQYERDAAGARERGKGMADAAAALAAAAGRSHGRCLHLASHLSVSLSREPLCRPLP